MTNNKEYQYTYITTAASTQVFTGKGTLQAITINNTTANGSIKIIDGVSGSTANVATLKASVPEGTYWYNCAISAGLRIVTAQATDITITWAKG